nr:uncharacterized protein CTRU02_05471 [Colletotrichum truncatum]KAF6793914.1 hypothetical protein CTRU02_05471 [Colletotrichum truncatum]
MNLYQPEPCTNKWCITRIEQLEARIKGLSCALQAATASRPNQPSNRSSYCTELQPLSPNSSRSRHGVSRRTGLALTSPPISGSPSSINIEVVTVANYAAPIPIPPPTARKPCTQVQKFLGELPRDEQEWQKIRKRTGLMDAEGIRNAFSDIMSTSFQAEYYEPRPSLRSHLFRSPVGTATRDRDDNNEQLNTFSEFRTLVFVGECCVALKRGATTEHVNNVMRQVYFSQTIEPQTLQKYRQVPARITKQMGHLYEHLYPNNKHRAFELFLHAKMSVSNYDKLSRADPADLLAKIKSIITSDTELDAPVHELHASLPFYLPFVIWARIFLQHGKDTFDEVNEVFQVENFTKADFHGWLRFSRLTPMNIDGGEEGAAAGGSRTRLLHLPFLNQHDQQAPLPTTGSKPATSSSAVQLSDQQIMDNLVTGTCLSSSDICYSHPPSQTIDDGFGGEPDPVEAYQVNASFSGNLSPNGTSQATSIHEQQPMVTRHWEANRENTTSQFVQPACSGALPSNHNHQVGSHAPQAGINTGVNIVPGSYHEQQSKACWWMPSFEQYELATSTGMVYPDQMGSPPWRGHSDMMPSSDIMLIGTEPFQHSSRLCVPHNDPYKRDCESLEYKHMRMRCVL